jgi:hypothetical protein
VDPKIPASISEELQKRLSKKMPVVTDTDPELAQTGAIVISGCITRADKGNALGRMVGMNLGASRLAAHVRILSKTASGLRFLDEFDVQVKGATVLPPIGPAGLAAHAVKERRETLSADAKHLADEILKKLSKDMKAQKASARSRNA